MSRALVSRKGGGGGPSSLGTFQGQSLGKPLLHPEQGSDMLEFTFNKDHSGCSGEKDWEELVVQMCRLLHCATVRTWCSGSPKEVSNQGLLPG